MSPLQALAPDQRAILELLLRQGRSYDELSEMLGLPEDGVRSRAHAALAALAPDRPAPVGEDGAVADWILGQQDGEEAGRTSASIARMPAWRAWAVEVTDRLAEVDGAEVPEVPDAEESGSRASGAVSDGKGRRRPRPVREAAAAGAGAAAAGAAASRRRPAREPVRAAEPAAAGSGSSSLRLPSSRLGGALLIGLLALLVAGGLFLIFRGGDEAEQTASTANASPTPTATPEVVSEIALEGVGNRAQGLMRVFRRPEDGRLVFALAADKMPQNKRREVYAVWFTKEGAAPRNLGFSQAQVGKEGVFTTGGPQQGQEAQFAEWLADYDKVVVARAGADTASTNRPGPIVLQGTLPGGQE